MIVNFNIKNFFNGFFYGLNSRITKFNNFTTVRENNVVMLFVKI
jgi:hypothetical protein